MIKRKRMRVWATLLSLTALTAGAGIGEAAAAVFDSGSSCVNTTDPDCLGAFSPTVNTTITLPPDGVLDYTTFTIPSGVTVWFAKNAANTPVVIRTTGNVTIQGTISVNAATSASHSGTASDGNLGDDGQPGTGGPGGFDGGFGGYSALFGGAGGKAGGSGKGPGGGGTGSGAHTNGYGHTGGGGGFGFAGGGGSIGAAGVTYGQATLLPLVGGSGGGGGAAGASYNGAGGGGGGGAITIASSTMITVGKAATAGAGRIFADGGSGGTSAGSGSGGSGAGGSGGGIRLVANTLTWVYDGYLYARGGAAGTANYYSAGAGGDGRIRLEANTITGWNVGNADPDYSFGLPGHVLVPNGPTIAITGVTPSGGAEVAVPANPTGNADITLAQGTTSATVSVAAANIPRGTTVTVYVVPASGANRSSALTNALDGASDAATTATATVTLSPGNNVLMAAATYTVTEIIAMGLPTFNGVHVAKIRVESTMGGESKVIYITANGKEYPADSPAKDTPQEKV